MSDEPTPIGQEAEETVQTPDDWVMPEPIFRTSDGHTPKTAKTSFEGEDVPTEIANREDPEDVEPPPNGSGKIIADIVEDEPSATKPKPKSGCARNFVFLIGLIGVVAAAVIIGLIYFLFYFRPAETGTF